MLRKEVLKNQLKKIDNMGFFQTFFNRLMKFGVTVRIFSEFFPFCYFLVEGALLNIGGATAPVHPPLRGPCLTLS